MRLVVFLIYPNFQLLDLTGPMSVFQIANVRLEEPAYELAVVSFDGGSVVSSTGLEVSSGALADLHQPVDTFLVCGGPVPSGLTAENFVAIRNISAHSRRTASVCTGAFLLAEAGLLHKRKATTHWRYAKLLQEKFEDALVHPDKIYTRDGKIWTSAGISAGIDLAIALVEDDHGVDQGKSIARELVVYHRRPGGQSQFSTIEDLGPQTDRIGRAIRFARENLALPLTPQTLADAALVSERQLWRLFKSETGETPAKAIERLRIEAAVTRLQDSAEPVESIAIAVGFGNAERMRRAFLRHLGQSPQSLRRTERRGEPDAC